MLFFVGIHRAAHVDKLPRAFVSANILWDRRSPIDARDWILDSGAFTQITQHGDFIHSVEEYAALIHRFRSCGQMIRAVSQDYMCEPFAREASGLTVAESQRKTIERYLQLRALCGDMMMPVIQGFAPDDYAQHVRDYADLLPFGCYAGVGSVCKRNGRPDEVLAVLRAIREVRPDLNLHGFGLKTRALQLASVRDILYSADSMAWSFAARYEGRDGNDWREAVRFGAAIDSQTVQESIF